MKRNTTWQVKEQWPHAQVHQRDVTRSHPRSLTSHPKPSQSRQPRGRERHPGQRGKRKRVSWVARPRPCERPTLTPELYLQSGHAREWRRDKPGKRARNRTLETHHLPCVFFLLARKLLTSYRKKFLSPGSKLAAITTGEFVGIPSGRLSNTSSHDDWIVGPDHSTPKQ